MLVALLALFSAGSARADYDSAVRAYDNGNYSSAYSQFRSLERQGDLRAKPYLSRLRDKGYGSSGAASGSSASSSGKSIWDFSSGKDDRSVQSSSGSSGDWSYGRSGSSGRAPSSGVVVPFHGSIWTKLAFFPADVTVIGLQYVAKIVNASTLEMELRRVSLDGNTIGMGLFALFWWFVIFKIGYALCGFFIEARRATLSSVDSES